MGIPKKGEKWKICAQVQYKVYMITISMLNIEDENIIHFVIVV